MAGLDGDAIDRDDDEADGDVDDYDDERDAGCLDEVEWFHRCATLVEFGPLDEGGASRDHGTRRSAGHAVNMVPGQRCAVVCRMSSRGVGARILCKPRTVANGELFSKDDFEKNFKLRTITCPAGQTQRFVPGQTVEFEAQICGACSLRSRCTSASSPAAVGTHAGQARALGPVPSATEGLCLPCDARMRRLTDIFSQLLAASAVSFVLLLPGMAGAAEGDTWVPRAQQNRVALKFDVWSYDDPLLGTAHSLTWSVAGQVKIARGVYLDFDVPWAVWDFRFPSTGLRETDATMGNLTLGVHWAGKVSERLAFHAGGTLSVPTSFTDGEMFHSSGSAVVDFFTLLPLSNAIRMPHEVASRNRAYADLHRFFLDSIVARGRGGLELRILPTLHYRADIVSILAFPVGILADRTHLFLEAHSEIAARASTGVGGGLRVQAVFFPTREGDKAQTALEPYFSYEPTRGFYARLGLLVALDDTLGFGFEEGKVATLRTALGGSW
ncbi:hypothetical protein [Polyangium sorediatum]|uniref:hypothetical protein n=1 Tax=Polyangium sorediatum TaxID=889274 RepID=UPI0010BDF7BD